MNPPPQSTSIVKRRKTSLDKMRPTLPPRTPTNFSRPDRKSTRLNSSHEIITLPLPDALPIYESTATVNIDRQTPQNVLGQDATHATATDADQFLATQIRILQSDSVLRPVATKLHLQDPLGDDPVVLEDLRISRPANTYLLQVSFRSKDPVLAAEAANSIAASYMDHTYRIRLDGAGSMTQFMERQLEELKSKIDRSSEALAAMERDLSVINPEERTNILAARLLQLNAESAAAEGDRLRHQAAYESVRDGGPEAAAATQQGEVLRRLAEHVQQAEEELVALQSTLGPQHPTYKQAQAKLAAAKEAYDRTQSGVVQRVESEHRQSERREEITREAVSAA